MNTPVPNNGRPLAVVTGATGGIGSAISLRLASEGFNLLCAYSSNHGLAAKLRQGIQQQGVQCQTVCCDFADPESVDVVESAAQDALNGFGGQLSGLVNNAALLLGPSLRDATVRQFDEYISVNARAPLFLTQRLSKFMVRGGAVVNISSAGVHFSSPGDIVYSMSKAALEALSFHAAEFLAERKIRINTVIPGFTDNGHELFSVPAAKEHMSSYSVLGGVASPGDVAEAVHFLISERSSRVTGTTLDISGGSLLGARQRTDGSLSLRSLRDE